MDSPPSRASRRPSTLLGLSLQYYRTEIRQRLMRYKQLILVCVLLLLPGMAAIKSVILMPLACIFGDQGGLAGACAAIASVMAAALWVGLQRDVIAYPPAAAFVASLPASRSALVVRDLAVLALASSPLLVLIFAGFLVSQPQDNAGVAILALLGVLVALFVAQRAVLRGAHTQVLVPILTAAAIGGVRRIDVLALLILPNAWLLWRIPANVPWRSGEYRQPHYREVPASWFLIGWVGLHWRSLYRSTNGAYRLYLLFSVVVTVVVAVAVHLGDGAPIRSLGLLLVHGVLITGLFGLGFTTLFKNQVAYQALLSSLPTSSFRRAFDMTVAAELPAVLMVLLLSLSVLRLASGLPIAMLALGVTVFLCSTQYLIYRNVPRHAIAAGLLVGIATVTTVLQLASDMGSYR